MATRKGIIITCLAILLDTVYAFCIFLYYILSNISLSQRLKLYIHVQNVYEYVLNKLIRIIIIIICTMLDQRRRSWSDIVQMLYKCFVFAG